MASYRSKDAAQIHQQLLWDNAEIAEVEASTSALRGMRGEILDIQTKITLLAPRRTFERSQELRWRVNAMHKGLDAANTLDQFEALTRAVAEARTEFINSAKKSLALGR